MNTKVLMKRIAALMLAAVMTLSMSGFAIEEVFADVEDGGVYTEEALGSSGTELTEDKKSEDKSQDGNADARAGDKADSGSEAGNNAEAPLLSSEPAKAENGTEENGQTGGSNSNDAANDGESGQAEPDELTGFAVTGFTAASDGTLSAALSWTAYDGAVKYEISTSGIEGTSEQASYTLEGLAKGQKYTVIVKAIDADNAVAAEGSFEVFTYVQNFRKASSKEESKISEGQIKYNNSITLTWEKVPGADSYEVTKTYTAPDGSEIGSVQRKETKNEAKGSDIKPVEGKENLLQVKFENLYPGRLYTFKVTAKSGSTVLMENIETAENTRIQPELSNLTGLGRSSNTIAPGRITFANGGTDLREYAGQTRGGWAVAQGGTSDGTFAYVLLVSSSKQTGKVAKYRISNGALVKVSGELQTTHGNGMTYDARRHRLVVIGRDDAVRGNHKQEITVIDADSLKIIQQQNIDYSYYASDNGYFDYSQRSKGLGAISYSPKFDVYVAKQRDHNNLIAIDPDTLKAIGLIKTRVNQYGGGGQAMDGDDQYVYMLKSGYGSSNTNIILALDWNGNKLIDSKEHVRKEFVPEYWGSPYTTEKARIYPEAMYTINTPHEGENIYHYYESNGFEHFYMTEYDANQQYTYSKEQKAYKVKWKKVKKKVKVKVKYKKKVKWKKKKNGKWKYKKVTRYKYKWKKKKVWKYKTKYKTVTVKTPTYKDRHDYVYDLGRL